MVERDSYLKYWRCRVNYFYSTGKRKHMYYAVLVAEKDGIKIEFHHLKKVLISIVCGKAFYETFDIPGCPPKKYMKDFRDKIVSECKYQMQRIGDIWDDSLIPENLY